MKNKFTLENDELWEKTTSLANCLHSITQTLATNRELSLCNKISQTIHELNVTISEGILTDNSSIQESCYSSALLLSREIDSQLQTIFDSTSKNQNKIWQQLLFTAFMLADQLREMLLNHKNDLTALKAS